MSNNLGVILAGGKGSRLKLNNEKIFTKINGKTLINHAISKLKKLNLDINIVTRKDLKLKIKTKKVKFHIQPQSLGTGHAINVFLKSKPKFKYCLIMNADTPFIHIQDLKKVIRLKDKVDLVALSYRNKKNSSNGIFLKDKFGKFFIKEYNLLNKTEKKINNCFSGIMLFNKKVSKEFLKIKKNKKKKEYLITDIFKLANYKKYTTKIVKASFPNLCLGINTLQDIKKINRKIGF